MNKILLVGCGHMGSALLTSWSKNTSFSFFVIDPYNYKNLRKRFARNIKFYKSFDDIKNKNSFNVIIFAIKPQNAEDILKEYSAITNKKTLYISIIAGKKISFFQNYLGINSQIIRVMPNMPAVIGKGMSCMFSMKNVTSTNKKFSLNLFNRVGKTLWLKKESDIDKITAVSGSGPAYYFLFIQCLEAVTSDLGFSHTISKSLVHQTAIGSIELLLHDKRSAKELKESIAIKGGTTEAAINIFEKNSTFKKIINKAIKAAHRQSLNLGK